METEPKLKPTPLDYALAALSPGLIILMIGSLVCFLLSVLYQGEFPARLMWILGLFTFASVLISRIAIEQTRAQSLVYLGLLGGATLLVAPRFFVVDGPMAPFSLPILVALLSLIAYLADRITMDATSVDEASESNGEGLLQSLGLLKRANASAKQSKRKHNPGVWILYFALLAIPVFGLGQLFIQAANTRKLAFVCMIAYLFSALALLVVISLLSLRKYVRQRGVEMEGSLSARWLSAGISSTLGLILLMAILPFPMLSSNLMELPFRITSRTDLASSQWGWGNEGAGNSGQQGDSKEHPAVQQKPAANQEPQQDQSADGRETPSQPGNGNAASNSNDDTSSGGNRSDQGDSSSGANQGTNPNSNNTNANESNPNGSNSGGSGATGPGSSNLKKNSSSSSQKSSSESSSGAESSNSGKPSSESDQQKNRSGEKESQNKPQSSNDQQSSGRNASNPASSDNRNSADNTTPKNERSDNTTTKNSQDPNRAQQTERNLDSKQQNQPEANEPPKPPSGNPNPDQNRNRDPRNDNPPNKPPEPQREPSQPKGFSMEWNLGATFRWLILAGLLLVTLYYGIRYRQQIILAVRDFFYRWFGWFSGGTDEDTGSDTPSSDETTIQQVLFSSFADPFQESPSDPNKIVRRLFAATVAWASEHRVRRRDDETPEEFLRRLGRKYSEIQDHLLQLGMLYSRLAYAQKPVPMNEARTLRPMWDWLVAHAPQSPRVPTPHSETAILSVDRN
ncbi:MAG: DUF4129 domain-containing protein [Pirellula sp.]|jgi:hypothetical protein